MGSVHILGNEEQKQRWLPAMARMEKIGAFALTEPDHGSDSVALETSARLEGDHYVINGAKRWIGNASFADIVVIWARDAATGRSRLSSWRKTPMAPTRTATGPRSSTARSANAPSCRQISPSRTFGSPRPISCPGDIIPRRYARPHSYPQQRILGISGSRHGSVSRQQLTTRVHASSSANHSEASNSYRTSSQTCSRK